MPDVFEEKIADFIRREKLFGAGENVLAGVSGGADSLGLVLVLEALYRGKILTGGLYIGHVDHGLRGKWSEMDAEFTRKSGEKLGISTEIRYVNVAEYARNRGISIETAGREVRRSALQAMAGRQNCTSIAMGHHQEDNAETLIFRMGRGTGYRGMGGIRPVREFGGVRFVRPLLCVRRAEIEAYCRRRGFEWRRDHTNESLDYARNRVRHQILPYLQSQSSGDIVSALDNLSASCRRMQVRIEAEAEQARHQAVTEETPDVVRFAKRVFNSFARPVRVEVLRAGLMRLGSGEGSLTQGHYERMLSFAAGGGGRTLELPGAYEMRVRRREFFLIRTDRP